MSTDVVVAVFPSRKILIRALDHLHEIVNLKIKRAAVVARARTGEMVVLDGELTANEGGIAGGSLGAALAGLGMVQLGALALPGVGPVIALGAGVLVGGLVGALTGRFATGFADFGFRREQIEALAEQLIEGHPALVLELTASRDAIDMLRQELAAFRVEFVEPLHRAALKQPPAVVK